MNTEKGSTSPPTVPTIPDTDVPVETWISLVERCSTSFLQYKAVAESAIASLRREVDDIREQVERLQHVQRNIFRFESDPLPVRIIRNPFPFDEDDSAASESAPSSIKRKRWGKRSTMRRRRRRNH